MTQIPSIKLEASNLTPAELRKQLGSLLSEARVMAGVSVEAVAHETKISKHFIVSLESGLFESLPGRVFGRGFIKNIARYLRSDSEILLKMYDECWGTILNPNSSQQNRIVRAPSTENIANSSVMGESKKSTLAAEFGRKNAIARLNSKEIPDIKHLPALHPRRKGLAFKVPTWLLRGFMNQHNWLTFLGILATVMVLGVFGQWLAGQMSKNRRLPKAELTSSGQVSGDSASPETQVNRTTQETSEPSFSIMDAPLPTIVVDKVIETKATVIEPPKTASGIFSPNAKSLESKVIEDSPLKIQGTPIAFEQLLEINVKAPVEMRITVDGKKSEKTA
ncbi:MAG: helix-turn-helix transcriptional regulator, partial [Proteobacteria bacterium]|nr:helix-turn-helix transcriptional regulator [Pseudomonadota bacterium]